MSTFNISTERLFNLCWPCQNNGTSRLQVRFPEVPVFYFNICDVGGFCEDDEGRELPSAEAAKAEAVRGLRDLMAGTIQTGEINLACFIEIEDESRELIATVSFEDAVTLIREAGQIPGRR